MQLVVVSAVSAAVSAATIIFATSSMICFLFIVLFFPFLCWFDISFNDAKVQHFSLPCKNNPDFPGYVKIWKKNEYCGFADFTQKISLLRQRNFIP